ncbi:MAG: hypothetical protein P9M07_08580 [Candidatus Aceula meridiana]|nr:hypothetical protein [Candidatus Aceula meridiana]
MGRFVTLIMYSLWTLTVIGVLVITFQGFQYPDLNILVGILLVLTVINSYFSIKENPKK